MGHAVQIRIRRCRTPVDPVVRFLAPFPLGFCPHPLPRKSAHRLLAGPPLSAHSLHTAACRFVGLSLGALHARLVS